MLKPRSRGRTYLSMTEATVESDFWSSGHPSRFDATAQHTDVMMERAPWLKYFELPTSMVSGRSIFTRSFAAAESFA